MKNDLRRCFVCGQEYRESKIKPIWFYEYNDEEWKKLSKINYQGNEIPLCSEHLRMFLLSFCVIKHLDIDVKR